MSLILSALEGKVSDIIVCLDAQVALSWILSGNVKSKNIFAKNRVNDIKLLRDDVRQNYNIECKFRYVPTELNPSDLVTRGL